MLRGEELGELRTEDRERRHAEQSGEVAGTRIVADEAIGVGERVEQAVHVAERIVQHGHRPAGGFEPAGDLAESLDGPLAHGLAGAGVNDHALPARRREARHLRREAPIEFAGQCAPIIGAMRARGRRQWPRQQQPRPGARETEPRAASGQRQHRMVARIGAGGDAEVEAGGAQGAPQGGEFAPRPAVQAVFAAERGPWRDEGHERYLRGEAAQQRGGVGLGQQRHVGVPGRRTEKRHGQGKIAETPELGHEQAGRSGIMGWFFQACRVKFSIIPMTSHTPRATGALWGALACALAGATVFQFCGNASRGYIDTASLFYWWGSQWVNPLSETQHGWLIVALSLWLFWRNLGIADTGWRIADSGERRADDGWQTTEGGRRTAESGGRTADGEDPKSKIQNPKFAALAAMLGGLALHLFGYFVQQARLSIVALLLFTWGVLALAGGRRWGRAAQFPLAFLLFAVPVSFLDTAGFWLRLWVIEASYGLAHLAGLDVMRSGTQLFAPDGAFQYDVAAACSGVRSLMALLALSLLAGYLNFRAGWLRSLLLLLSLPFTYVGNVVRIAAIIFAAQWLGQKAGAWVHEWAGFLVFAIVLGLVLATIAVIKRCWPQTAAPEARAVGPAGESASPQTQAHGRDARATRAGGQAWHGRLAHVRKMWGESRWWTPPEYAGSLRRVLVAVGAGALIVAAGTRWIDARPPVAEAGVRLAAGQVDPVELPTFLGNAWIGRRAEVTAFEREILPPDTGYSRKLYVSLDDPGRRVFLSIVLSGRDRSSIHRPELCLVGQGWTIEGAATHRFRDSGRAGADFPATVLRVRRETPGPAGRPAAPPEIVAYWFVGHDRVVAAYGQRMWYDALARIQSVLDATLPVLHAD